YSCESMPDWIISLESVITIEIDDSCNLSIYFSSDLSNGHSVYSFDRIAVLASGRNGNLQNRLKRKTMIEIHDVSNVTLNMNLTFDWEDPGSIRVLTRKGGEINEFDENGTYTKTLITNYLEIQWLPQSTLYASEVIKNNDNIYIDIQISYTNNDYRCPHGYSLVAPTDNESWCYTIVWYIPPNRFTYEAAGAYCDALGDSLPIVASQEINHALALFAHKHLALDYIWLAMYCDYDSDKFMWQDDQPLNYYAFERGQG
ncbi:hypothetical protein PMAYCL1PPCAC_03982, partial [Pristionchus mayeri]